MHDAQGVDPRSPRFGAAITSVLLAVALVLALTDGTHALGVVLLAALAGLFAWGGFAGIRRHPYAALLNAAFDVCLGCLLYVRLLRAGLVRSPRQTV